MSVAGDLVTQIQATRAAIAERDEARAERESFRECLLLALEQLHEVQRRIAHLEAANARLRDEARRMREQALGGVAA